ncbi:MAG TPA: hypothetical protein VGA63_06465 [Geopsychrobacteraceae bacterium]|jgi:hypothetical protein
MGKKIALLSAECAAQRLNTTPLNVLMHIKRGLLKGQEFDGGWFVLADSLERFIAENGGEKSAALCRKGCSGNSSCASSCG